MEGAFIDWAGILNSLNLRFLSHGMCVMVLLFQIYWGDIWKAPLLAYTGYLTNGNSYYDKSPLRGKCLSLFLYKEFRMPFPPLLSCPLVEGTYFSRWAQAWCVLKPSVNPSNSICQLLPCLENHSTCLIFGHWWLSVSMHVFNITYVLRFFLCVQHVCKCRVTAESGSKGEHRYCPHCFLSLCARVLVCVCVCVCVKNVRQKQIDTEASLRWW